MHFTWLTPDNLIISDNKLFALIKSFHYGNKQWQGCFFKKQQPVEEYFFFFKVSFNKQIRHFNI